MLTTPMMSANCSCGSSVLMGSDATSSFGDCNWQLSYQRAVSNPTVEQHLCMHNRCSLLCSMPCCNGLLRRWQSFKTVIMILSLEASFTLKTERINPKDLWLNVSSKLDLFLDHSKAFNFHLQSLKRHVAFGECRMQSCKDSTVERHTIIVTNMSTTPLTINPARIRAMTKPTSAKNQRTRAREKSLLNHVTILAKLTMIFAIFQNEEQIRGPHCFKHICTVAEPKKEEQWIPVTI